MARRKPWIRNRKTAQWAGFAFSIAGALLLYDAYENRGRSRPLGARAIPL